MRLYIYDGYYDMRKTMPTPEVSSSTTVSDEQKLEVVPEVKQVAKPVKAEKVVKVIKVDKEVKPIVTELSRSVIFLDREMSQIAFNWRVLAQAEDRSIPLLERPKYLSIGCSNLY